MNIDISSRMQDLSVQILPFLGAIIVHEYGHAWMASRQGDTTAKDMGRLTLNPLAHLDVLGSVLIPIINIFFKAPIFIGWAKPVPIIPENFKHYRRGVFLVALAGPLANFITAFLAACACVGSQHFFPQDSILGEFFLKVTLYVIHINCSLGVFNLLPLPPLDGAQMIFALLPSYWSKHPFIELLRQNSLLIFFFLIFSRVFELLIIPIKALSFWLFVLATQLFSLLM